MSLISLAARTIFTNYVSLTCPGRNGGNRPNESSVNVQMVGKISQAVMNEFINNDKQTTSENPDQKSTNQQMDEGEYTSRNV